MNQINISVIIPIYNVEFYLEECLNSVLQQDYIDYEVICVNDASTDGSEIILLNYAKKYEKIKTVNHKRNKGLSSARNTGLKNAVGKYIVFIDSDDMIVENTLTELYNMAESTNVDIIYFNMINFYEDAETSKKIYEDLKLYEEYTGIYSGKELFCLQMDKHQVNIQAVRKFIRKDFLMENEIKFYDGILHEDVLFSFYCAMNAKRVININKEYYMRRLREGSITHIHDFKRAQSLFVVMIQILAYWSTHIFTMRENQAIEHYFQNIYNDYKRYKSWFGSEKDKLEFGGYAEKTIYSMLHGSFIYNRIMLHESQLKKISKFKNVIVFGAGAASMDVLNILQERNIKVNVIAVSDTLNNPKLLCGIKVDSIDHIMYDIRETIVVIGVTVKYHAEIQRKLKQLGYDNIIVPVEIT